MSRYENLLSLINRSPRLSFILKAYCHLSAFESIFVFIYMLAFFGRISLGMCLGFCVTLAFPLLAVSFARRLINSKRPYEVYDFFVNIPKNKKGSSFPSRHAFSMFAIGTLCVFVNPLLGVITLLLGLLMCVCRVLLGIHFIRDVLAGAIIGVITSLIGVFILL